MVALGLRERERGCERVGLKGSEPRRLRQTRAK